MTTKRTHEQVLKDTNRIQHRYKNSLKAFLALNFPSAFYASVKLSENGKSAIVKLFYEKHRYSETFFYHWNNKRWRQFFESNLLLKALDQNKKEVAFDLIKA